MHSSLVPFTGYPLDRADVQRGDAEALNGLWRRHDVDAVVFWRGKPAVTFDDGVCALARVPAASLAEAAWVRLFLGNTEEGQPVVAACLDPSKPTEAPEGASFADLRQAAGALSLPEAALAGTARAVFAWHRCSGFCPACGQPTTVAYGGWKRVCDCGREHFPRVEPVVIALVTHTDRVLLGRGPSWPQGFFSCLAGFVESGETLGDATRREVQEESSVEVGDVTFLMSQPWPFPASLMLGVCAEALTEDVVVDGEELAEARWFSRAEVAEIMAGTHETVHAPFSVAVAHHLLRWWLDQG
ncbi:MAG: NAD(+) diphosphatase [Myxococcales bacterium]|nr:NAD(+) diphosphatase [Myxococcales bacterium]